LLPARLALFWSLVSEVLPPQQALESAHPGPIIFSGRTMASKSSA
jgi:hypothetical protein